MEKKLDKTGSSFKLRGIVTRLHSDKAYSEGQNKNRPGQWRKLRFGIQTSKTNTVFVEILAWTKDQITAGRYDEKTKKRESRKFDWNQRKNLPAGFAPFGVRVALDRDENGKLVSRSLVDYDAIEYIRNKLVDGKSVYVSGEVKYNEYNGKVTPQFNVKYISLQNDINFDDPDFKEVAVFEQQMVFVDMQEQDDKYLVFGRMIDFNEKWVDYGFVIRKDDPDLAALGMNAQQYLGFGHLIKTEGLIVNRVETSQEAVTIENIFGGKQTGLFNTVTKYINELQITYIHGGDDWVKDKYTQEDFLVPQQLVQNQQTTVDNNPFGGNKVIKDMFIDEDPLDPFAD